MYILCGTTLTCRPRTGPTPQCASNNARLLITEACRPGLHTAAAVSARKLGEDLPTGFMHCLASTGSSLKHSTRVLVLVIAEYFTAPEYTPLQGESQVMRPVGFFIWFASGVKAFQTRAVPGSAADDAETKQNEQPYPHSEQVIYQKARSYDRFLNFFCQKVVKMRQRFFFLCFRFSAEHSFLCCCVKLIFLNFTRYSVKLFVLVFQFVFLLHHRFHRTCKTRRQILKFWLFILKPRDGI